MSDSLTPAEEAYFATGGGDSPAAPAPEAKAPAAPAPEPVEQAAPEPEEHDEPAEAAEPDARRQTTVPLGALDKERGRRKALETELATLRGEVTGRFTQLEQFLRPQQPQQQAPGIPDFNTDPRGHIEARLSSFEQQTQQMRQAEQQRVQAEQQQSAVRQVIAHANADEATFAKATPDYHEATQFLRAQREAELKVQGYDGQQLADTIRQETLALAAGALQQGKSFAQLIYGMSKARGFTGGAAASGDADQLDTIARGQQLATGVGSAGRAPPASLTRERVANMSEQQFARLSEDQQRKFLGG